MVHYLISLFAIVGFAAFITAPEQVENNRVASGVVTHAVANAQQTELQCLAENIFYEAGVESHAGKYAVAQVTVNRLRTGRWGDSICSVVHSPRQFSWTINPVREVPRGKNWEDSVKIARQVMRGKRVAHLQTALYYHATYVNPLWRKKSAQIAKIGVHVFYSAAKIQAS